MWRILAGAARPVAYTQVVTSDPLADFDAEIVQFLVSSGVPSDLIQLSTPPEQEFGERATNVAFRLAKEWRKAPKQIAEELAASFDVGSYRFLQRVQPAGAGFINFYLDYGAFIPHMVEAVELAGTAFGRRDGVEVRDVVVEHTSVNPNKEWHIGHARNAVLGDVVSRVLRQAGHRVEVQNYIDDTGPQAATSIVGFQDFPEPQRPGEKFDHWVGRSYVKVSEELRAEPALRKRLEEIQAGPGQPAGGQIDERRSIQARLENIERLKARVVGTMRALESGEYGPLVQRILNAQLQTAYRLGVFYDLLTWESNLIESRLFQDAMDQVRRSSRVKQPAEGRYAGALVIETGLPVEGEETKAEVLIRSNGLPTYIGKDIAYHMWKFHLVPNRLCYMPFATQPNGAVLWSTSLHGQERDDTAPSQIINIIAVDQSAAQDAVREGLRAAGFGEAADELFHLAYGLVMTAEGKLTGRRGAIAADDVIDEAVRVAYDRVKEKRSQDLSEEDMRRIAEAVGVGAVRYFMVQYNPLRDIVFDVSDVVSYDGNTALYIQYALVRMFAILRRAADAGATEDEIDGADLTLLTHPQEQRLIYQLALLPGVVADTSRTLGVNLVAEYAFNLATIFSQFYRDCPVIGADAVLRNARLRLVRAVREVLSLACALLGVPVIERL
jgi:arginyl-tRNA synthetase